MLQRVVVPGVVASFVLVGACADPTPWSPGTVFRTPEGATVRGFLDRRGLVHAHSVYSHDACDGEPETNGVRNAACFEDFRRDLCTVKHDFVFLTDHPTSFTEYEYPEVLLYRADRGDVLVQRNGTPIANRAACPDGHVSLIMGGTEAETMPVGLERHPVGRADRGALYARTDDEALTTFRNHGAVTLVAHTENWTDDQLVDMKLDGFEMYNLHANTYLAAAKIILLLNDLLEGKEGMTHPDLAFLFVQSEDPVYLARWGSVLARGVQRTTTMGTDCHRNTFKDLMQDGERIDSYRRMMSWFSNHLLVKPDADGTYDDRHLKDALRSGRLYGVFEALGYADGFDYRAEAGGTTHEMGEVVTLASKPVLKVTMPRVLHFDTTQEKPALTIRVLRAKAGGWDEVATGTTDVTYVPDAAGAYRSEVRVVPHHLRSKMGDEADGLLARDYVWVYSNAIYVR